MVDFEILVSECKYIISMGSVRERESPFRGVDTYIMRSEVLRVHERAFC